MLVILQRMKMVSKRNVSEPGQLLEVVVRGVDEAEASLEAPQDDKDEFVYLNETVYFPSICKLFSHHIFSFTTFIL